jgi:hypothetical protein
MGKISAARDWPEAALLRYLPVAGRSAASEVNPGKIISFSYDGATVSPASYSAICKQRPVEAEPRMDVEQVARAVVYMATLPLDANVKFMTAMATKMPYIGRG